MPAQPCHALAVDFGKHKIVGSVVRQQKLRQHTRAGPYFKHRKAAVRVERRRNAFGHRHVGEKMLPEGFLGFTYP